MTKKQNRVRGFGKRSLSVVLSVLMILSTLVVMLSATSLSAGAAISYWNVAGDFNNWENSLNNTSYRINGGTGSVTVNISSDSHSTITFKMCAYEDGWKWCGNSSGSASNGSETELSWNSGNDIKVNLPSGTTQVTFKIDSRNSKNYLTVTANGSGGGGGGSDTSQMTYSAPVNKSNNANKASDLFWASATYFDYESDKELTDGWLKPVQAGTHNFNGAQDEWYPFYIFNRNVVKAQADSQSSWSIPLYFGNFCDTNNAYDSAHHQNGYDPYGYREATNSYNVTRFVHIANNSDYNQSGSDHLANMNCSYQGLVNSKLSSSGDLLLPNGQQAPYFDASEDGPLKGYAKVVNSSFPFKVTEITDSTTNGKYKKYTFNSKNATDNVYFTWGTNGSTTYPTGVNYGAGTTYGVLDGVSRFMTGGTSGYGIFPFNNASSNYKGTKTNANENLNYGFGIKTQVKFRVPKKGKTGNTANDHTTFKFSGDDDLWMYITDDKGNSQLLLDMGGDHKESKGEVDFYNLTATVANVGTGGGSVTKSFTFDYTKTYTMTVFYMERGLIESNCEMEFSMTPLGNNFVVSEQIDTVDVNPGLQEIVTGLSRFGFNTYKDGSVVDDEDYSSFTLGNGELTEIGDSVLPMHSLVKIKQFAPQNSFLTYTTSWDYYDNLTGTYLGGGTGVTSNGETTITNENELINEENDDYEFAELRVDYRNTPVITDVKVTKEVENYEYLPDDMKDDEFPCTILLQLSSDMEPTAFDGLETSKGTYDFASGDKIYLKHGETVTINDVPVGTHVSVVEDLDAFDGAYAQEGGTGIVGDDDEIIVTNIPYEPIYEEVSGMKALDGLDYTGDLFTFRIEGVPRFDGDAPDVIDTSATTPALSTNTVTNGTFTIGDKASKDKTKALYLDRPGVYRYHVYEEEPENPDYYTFGNEYLVKITVVITKVDGMPALKPTIEYIPYSPYEDTISSGAGSSEPIPHTMVSADFDKTAASEMIFDNFINTGSVRILKNGPTDAPVSGAEFTVIKVDDRVSGILFDTSRTEAERYDAIMAYGGKDIAGSGTTGSDGYAYIGDLQIYEQDFLDQHTNGGQISISSADQPDYQQYVLLEASAPDGYTVNKTLNVFRFPINGQYDFTFSEDQAYVDGMIKLPDASGPGMRTVTIVGLTIIFFSVVLLGFYMVRNKRKAYQPVHTKKK